MKKHRCRKCLIRNSLPAPIPMRPERTAGTIIGISQGKPDITKLSGQGYFREQLLKQATDNDLSIPVRAFRPEVIPMTISEAIEARHSVRAYQNKQIDQETRQQLNRFAEKCNQESGLHIFIRYDDPDGFDSRLAHYGHFRNVKNYIVLAGKKTEDFDFICGYYGEKMVLFAQQHGLNTCWTALTFNKKTVRKMIPDGETLCMVIALGYGETQGANRKSKTPGDVVKGTTNQLWFQKGIDAALKAPTAINQQKFLFSIKNGAPFVQVKGWGSYAKVDLGIVAYHFEIASGKKVRH